MVTGTRVRPDGTWRWVGWASWPVSTAILVVAGLALVVDLVTAWVGKPEWYLGRILVSPALPLAVLLLVLVALQRVGHETATLRAWREFLVVTGAAIVAAALGYAHSVAGWREVEGVVLTAADVLLILLLQQRGFRWLEAFIISLILVIGVCFAIELARCSWSARRARGWWAAIGATPPRGEPDRCAPASSVQRCCSRCSPATSRR